MRVGTAPTASPPAGPNSASGRLLPVDVNPGTRQSLTVLHHLDGHRPHALYLALVERRPMDQLAHRAHHALRLPRLEELDHPQRRLDVREQALELAGGRGRALSPRRLEWPAVVAPRHGQFVQHQHEDRKSTRLNSSHEWISYAVFCLKKKNKHKTRQAQTYE